MSPEQAKGHEVDARSDTFSFGSLLYEMRTGRPAFQGETIADTLANVLKHEPDWNALPSDTPTSISTLLRRCLTKDRRQRLQAIGEARIAIESAIGAPDTNQSKKRTVVQARAFAGWVAGALLAAAAVWGWFRPQSQADPPMNLALTIVLPNESAPRQLGGLGTDPLISPDGSAVLYRGRGGLLLRRLESFEPQPLPGTADQNGPAFWSADSRSVAFLGVGSALKKMRVPDGAAEVISQNTFTGGIQQGSWSDTGKILVAGRVSGGYRLFTLQADGGPTGGGEAKLVDVPGLKEGSYYEPEFLPGGNDFIFTFLPATGDQAEVYLATLHNTKAADPVLLFKNDTAAHFTSAFGGLILFVRGDTLYAQRFNRKTHKLEGDPERVARGVATAPAFYRAEFSVSLSGVLAWRRGAAEGLSQMTIFDHGGNPVGVAGPPGPIGFVRLSPDETHLLAANDQSARLLESGRPAGLPFGSGLWRFWSPDGLRLIGLQGSKIVERDASGAGQVRELADAPGVQRLEDISPDGSLVLYRGDNASGFSIRLDGPVQERVPKPALQTGESIINTRFSPDGRWVVYRTLKNAKTPQPGIYVQPFPGPGLPTLITEGGSYPVWRKDGKEILYLEQNQIWSVSVEPAGANLHFGAPQALFTVRPPPLTIGMDPLAVSRDGSRIFFPQEVKPPEDSNAIQIRSGWAK